jgi:hypothetical protein
MKTKEEKARQMFRIRILEEILNRRKTIDDLMNQFHQSRENNLLQELAQLMLINQSKSEVAQALVQKLNMDSKEEKALAMILDKF